MRRSHEHVVRARRIHDGLRPDGHAVLHGVGGDVGRVPEGGRQQTLNEVLREVVESRGAAAEYTAKEAGLLDWLRQRGQE